MSSLFSNNQSITEQPIKLIWVIRADNSSPFPANAAFAVSKKLFPKAVHRNKIKRLMRESYRLHKQGLYAHLWQNDKQIDLALIFTGKKLDSFNNIEAKIALILKRLVESI